MKGAVAVAGDSATLAALCCLRLRDEDPPSLPTLRVLLNANTDLTGGRPSVREKATGWGLEVPMIRFFNSQWVPDERPLLRSGREPIARSGCIRTSGGPGRVRRARPPARRSRSLYAERLHSAGIEVQLRREPGLIQNFIMLDEISPACAAAADRVAADIRTRLSAV